VRDRRDVLAAFGRIRETGVVAALATVVHVVGSAYRRPGARMLLGADGTRVGLVSGGCLEADLALRARPVLERGTPAVVTYDARTDEDLIFGLGLGCEGKVEVLLERVPERGDGGHLAQIGRCVAERKRLALATVFRSAGPVPVGARFWRVEGEAGHADFEDGRLAEALDHAAHAVLQTNRHQNVTLEAAGGPVDALVEPVLPDPRLVVFGAGPDAQPLVRFAAELGFDVVVVDHRPAYAQASAFPAASRVLLSENEPVPEGLDLGADTAVLVMSHAYARDREYLRHLLVRELGYLGALGPRRRTERLLAELAAEAVVPSARMRARLHAPVGLDIGAETPEEIAVAILAEIRAELAGRAGGRLRDRDAPIHGAEPEA
jgi:xanthine/CO dehydrogenase XdhC/CoxF family maturation factor